MGEPLWKAEEPRAETRGRAGKIPTAFQGWMPVLETRMRSHEERWGLTSQDDVFLETWRPDREDDGAGAKDEAAGMQDGRPEGHPLSWFRWLYPTILRHATRPAAPSGAAPRPERRYLSPYRCCVVGHPNTQQS